MTAVKREEVDEDIDPTILLEKLAYLFRLLSLNQQLGSTIASLHTLSVQHGLSKKLGIIEKQGSGGLKFDKICKNNHQQNYCTIFCINVDILLLFIDIEQREFSVEQIVLVISSHVSTMFVIHDCGVI